jgi:hypothetical protein
MSDRIDHRAEAEGLLVDAERCLDNVDIDREPIACALVGILHVLLAHTGEGLPTRETPRPHSRACGFRAHPHGPECHPNCPTCGGQA